MSFLKGSSHVTVLRFDGNGSPTLDQIVESFNNNVILPPEKIQMTEIDGWSNSRDILKRHFTYDDVIGSVFNCNYVKCVKKIPSSLKKVHVTQKIEEYKLVHNGKAPRGEDKIGIIDEVEKMLLPFAVPTFKVIPILVYANDGYIFVGSNKIDAVDDVASLVRRTFEEYAVEVAYDQEMSASRTPYENPSGPHAFPTQNMDDENDMSDSTSMLTWLYYMWEKNGKIESADLLFEDGMTFANISAKGPQRATLAKGEAPLEGNMPFELFRKSYLLNEANLHIVTRDAVPQDFQFGLDINLCLLKVKPPKKIALDERMDYFKDCVEAWKRVVSEFVSLRSDTKRWEKVVSEFKDFVNAKLA